MSSLQRIFHVLYGMAHRRLQLNLVEFLDEEVTVFRIHDSLDAGSQHLDAVFLQRAIQIQFRTAIQGSLSAECQQDTVRTLLLDNLCHEVSRHGLKIHLVGNTLRSLDGGNVRIDQHTGYSLFA